MFDDEDLDDEDLDDEDLDDEDLDTEVLGDCTLEDFAARYLFTHFTCKYPRGLHPIEAMSAEDRSDYIQALQILDRLIKAPGARAMKDLTPLAVARWWYEVWKAAGRSKRRRKRAEAEVWRILEYAGWVGFLNFSPGDVTTRGFAELRVELRVERQRRWARRAAQKLAKISAAELHRSARLLGAGQVELLQTQPAEGLDPEIPPVPVVLGGPDDPPRVLGVEREPLNRTQWKVVKSLLDAGPDGLREPELRTICGDARGVLKRLERSDPDYWGKVLFTPGKRGGHYRGSERRYRFRYPPELIDAC